MASRLADLSLTEGWFGAIVISAPGSVRDALTPEQQAASSKIAEHNELSAKTAETMYCILAQALMFLASTAPEVRSAITGIDLRDLSGYGQA